MSTKQDPIILSRKNNMFFHLPKGLHVFLTWNNQVRNEKIDLLSIESWWFNRDPLQ